MKVRYLSTSLSTGLHTNFNKTYSINEDELCHWWLYKNGWRFASSKTPYPLIEEALKQDWIAPREAMEVASELNLKFKFIESYGGSLNELET